VPGTLFGLLMEMSVGELVALVPVYAIPFPDKETPTELAANCFNVIGEPVGVHRLPMAFELQPASVPIPGLRVCRSILIRPPGWLGRGLIILLITETRLAHVL
jgi:hypothetical protein